MKQPLKIAIFSLIIMVVTTVTLYLLWVRSIEDGGSQSRREIEVTTEYAQAIRAAGYPISIQRVYQASSYDGFHGDGSTVQASVYPPTESQALVDSLKAKYPTYLWKEEPKEVVTLGGLKHRLAYDFLPTSETLLVGKPAVGLPLLMFVVDREKGILYSIDQQY